MDRRFYFSVISVLLLLVTGCNESHNNEMESAYQLTNTNPDSALAVLQTLHHEKFSKKEDAKYALVYTIAQDKSGVDVDNDSLLRTAYTYYNSRPGDSLYAKCEYYMGKYYMLNGSLELAIDCLQKSASTAERQKDKYTMCLAFGKLSDALGNSNPIKGLSIAKKADSIYSRLPDVTIINKTYSKLQVSKLYLFTDSLEMAVRTCQEALEFAKQSGDSVCISDTYQDLASILGEKRDYDEALLYSKKSVEYSASTDIHKKLNLAWAYIDADSIQKGEDILNAIKTEKPEELYTEFYLQHIAALKNHDYSKAVNFADSSYHFIEKMYAEELNYKEKYYNALVKTQYENGINEGRADGFRWFAFLISFSALIIICLITYNYRQYKQMASQKMQNEANARRLEKKIHEKELKHKEFQLSAMRSYILKKIDIAQKIDTIRENDKNSVVLTDQDWEEIRIFVDSVEGDFVIRLKEKFPLLNEDDIKFMMLIRLRMPSRAMGLIYNISEKSIRQKLFVYKSKVGLESGDKLSLRSFIGDF